MPRRRRTRAQDRARRIQDERDLNASLIEEERAHTERDEHAQAQRAEREQQAKDQAAELDPPPF
jgi:hypothetical protein